MALVERTTRRVAMTQAGELLVARARRALAELDAAQAELQSLAGVQAGRLSVGALHTMGPVDLSLLLATFHERYPGDRAHRPRAVQRGARGDAARGRDRPRVPVGHRAHPEPRPDAAPARQRGARRRARRRSPARRRARGCACATSPTSRSSASARARGCASCSCRAAAGAGFEPRIALESNESRRIRSLVSRGLGVAILPRSDAEGPGAEVAVCDLVEPPLTRDVTLASRAERRPSPAAEAFLAIALEVYGAGRTLASQR